MKNKFFVSIILLIITGIIFFWLYNYPNSNSFDYNKAQFFSYLFYWGCALFLSSLFALMIDSKRYKIWFFISIIYFSISIFVAHSLGYSSSGILDIGGQLATLWLASLYTFISIIYCIVQFIKNRKK